MPDETVTLKSNNKSDVTGTITQDKISWTYADLGTDANGSVVAEDLTSGKWSGSFNFNIELVSEDVAGDVIELPDINKDVSEMTWPEIQAIAKAGKTTDYGIEVGFTKAVNDSVNAQVTEIGSDYIEFATTNKVVVYDSASQQTVSVGGTNINHYNASFYRAPQVNNGTTNTTTVGYNGSNIQSQVHAWFDAQSDEFKASVKESNVTYETATLTFDGSKYSQTAANGTVEVAEKVYIPTKADLEAGKFASNPAYTRNYFWTSTPFAFSGDAGAHHSFGRFYYGGYGYVSNNYGNYNYGAVALFKIG